MGFLSNDYINGTIVLDCVLTDKGRRFMARGDGSFNPTKFTVADDEIDYNLWDSSSPGGEDAKIITTPILEGFINESFALKYPAMSCDIPNLRYLPKISVEPISVSKYYRDAIKNAFTVTVVQKMISNDVASIPTSIWDPSFIVEMDDDLLYLEDADLVNISSYNRSNWIIMSTATSISNVNQSVARFRTREITENVWSAYGIGTSPSRYINTIAKFTGVNSGLHTTIMVRLNESAS